MKKIICEAQNVKLKLKIVNNQPENNKDNNRQ